MINTDDEYHRFIDDILNIMFNSSKIVDSNVVYDDKGKPIYLVSVKKYILESGKEIIEYDVKEYGKGE